MEYSGICHWAEILSPLIAEVDHGLGLQSIIHLSGKIAIFQQASARQV